MRRVKVLFIHQNFPGQFRHIAAHLAKRPGADVRAIGRENAPGLGSVPMWRYRPHRPVGKHTHPYARTFENGVLHGQQVLRLLLEASSRRYRPDIIIAHPGWGETLYVKQVYPDVPLVHFCEWYYHAKGADADFDPEFPLSKHGAAVLHSRNALHLLNLENADLGITPTRWQHSLHPAAYRDKIKVIHEGINTEHLGPDPEAVLNLPNGQQVRPGDPVVTYVARNLEPYRGFHRFMRALPKLLEFHDACQVVIVGGDEVSYGSRPKKASSWRAQLLDENPINTSRVHFMGKVDYATFRTVLQISAVHVYLTYPFVLSWSLLEAMACGCLIVGSNTAPVREVITHGQNGWLVDFFDANGLVDAIVDGLKMTTEHARVREHARLAAQRYAISKGISRYIREIDILINTTPGRRNVGRR